MTNITSRRLSRVLGLFGQRILCTGILALLLPACQGKADTEVGVAKEKAAPSAPEARPAQAPVPVSSASTTAPGAVFQTGRAPYIPEGWVFADPFTEQTRFFPGLTALSTAKAVLPPGTRVAMLRDTGQAQLFFYLGPREALLAKVLVRVKDLETHPLTQKKERRMIGTLDGSTLDMLVHEMSEGLLAGRAQTSVLIWGSVGEQLFVVSAVSEQGVLLPDGVAKLVQPLDLSKDLLPSR